MDNKKTIFITGANRGIGLAMVKESLKNNLALHFQMNRYPNQKKSYLKMYNPLQLNHTLYLPDKLSYLIFEEIQKRLMLFQVIAQE